MLKCKHQKIVVDEVPELVWDDIAEDHVYKTQRVSYPVSTLEDLDLHRLKCTQCGEIQYYSKAAKDFFEKGIPSPGILGLE